MVENPYRWQQDQPAHVVARADLVAQIEGHLRRGVVVKLVGSRGMGKSVLLRQVQGRFADEPDTRVVLVPRNSQIWFFAENNDDKNHFVTTVRMLIESGSVPALFVRIGPSEFCTTARLVQHRYNDIFIHARTQDEDKEFLRILPKIWTEVEAGLRNEMMLDQIVSPSVTAHMSIDHDYVIGRSRR